MDPDTLSPWTEWKERCAAGLCVETTQRALEAFGYGRFLRFVEKYDPELPKATAAEVWHLFETHLIASPRRGGKTYKDWLFQRLETHQGAPWEIIHSGATLLMRSVAREHCCQEGRGRQRGGPLTVRSTDTPVIGMDGRSITFGELLPSPVCTASDVILRDYCRLAASVAAALLPELNLRQRLVLVAESIGLGLSDPRVKEIAGITSNVLYDTSHAIEDRIEQAVARQYAGEDPAGLQLLSALTRRELQQMSAAKKPPENWQERLFLLLEEKPI